MIAEEIGDEGLLLRLRRAVGYLDHALASPSLVDQIAGVTEWHINADEPTGPRLQHRLQVRLARSTGFYAPDPFRSSDHDPVLIGLDLVPQGGAAGR